VVYSWVMTSPTEQERLLLNILAQDDDQDDELTEDGEAEKDAVESLDDHQRALLQNLLGAETPTPDEIARQAQMAERNAEIQRKREEKLAARREKQKHVGRGKYRKLKSKKNKKRRRR